MICCKIIANFRVVDNKVMLLCSALSKKGSWFWDGYNLYFADIEGSTNEKKVMKMVKHAGFTSAYIDVYSVDNEPNDTEEAKAWVGDKLFRIYYKQFEDEHQQVLQETRDGLNQLTAEVRQMIKESMEKKKQKNKKKPKSKKDGG